MTRETYGVQIVFIACHMDPISPDVQELSHRDIQPVETKMDGHHLGPSSTSPQTDVLRCLIPELFVCCNLPHTAPPKNVYQESSTSNKVPVCKISSFHHFQISFYGVAFHCDSLKNLNAVSQILCNLSGFDKSTLIKISVLFISIQ